MRGIAQTGVEPAIRGPGGSRLVPDSARRLTRRFIRNLPFQCMPRLDYELSDRGRMPDRTLTQRENIVGAVGVVVTTCEVTRIEREDRSRPAESQFDQWHGRVVRRFDVAGKYRKA